MSEQIRVRLVPKTREGDSIAKDLAEIPPLITKRFLPDVKRTAEALRKSLHIGIPAKITRNNSLDASVPIAKFKKIFKTDLIEKKSKEPAVRVFRGAESVLAPKSELIVPEELKDTIAFAYMPTPPEFYGISFISPCVSVYHLRLSEVLRSLNGSLCHRNGWTGRNIRVAMADTGFARHPYFDSQGYNIQRVSTPGLDDPASDTSGHGTGESANVLVMAPDCQFIGVKHSDYSALALETSLEQSPHIISNSWGWDIDKYTKEEIKNTDPNLFNEIRDVEFIINDAIDDGVIMVFAAGNGHKAFPASIPDVIAVGGVTVEADGALKASSYASSFESQLYPGRQVPDVCGIVGEYGSEPMKGHIMLPVPNNCELEGENMPVSKSKKGWGIFSGTSAACPQAAGIAALMLSAKPDLTPAQVKSILQETAKDVIKGSTGLGDEARTGPDEATGAGFIDAYQACLSAGRMGG
ncbi:S8 family serine peptidase [Acidobacteriota bacterium]